MAGVPNRPQGRANDSPATDFLGPHSDRRTVDEISAAMTSFVMTIRAKTTIFASQRTT
jgi:hypothetical protein